MSHAFTPKEKSLRKQWLVLTVISILIWPLVTLIMLAMIAKKEQIPSNAFSYIAVGIAFTFVVFYLLYRCAYVKPGLRFLTLVMIIGPLLKIKGMVDVLKSEHDRVAFISILLNVAVYAWWYYLSFKLWKMNKRVSHKR